MINNLRPYFFSLFLIIILLQYNTAHAESFITGKTTNVYKVTSDRFYFNKNAIQLFSNFQNSIVDKLSNYNQQKLVAEKTLAQKLSENPTGISRAKVIEEYKNTLSDLKMDYCKNVRQDIAAYEKNASMITTKYMPPY